jgi:hypothetical protein
MMSTCFSKHVEAWNKYIEKECVKLVINQNYVEMHGQQNIKTSMRVDCYWYKVAGSKYGYLEWGCCVTFEETPGYVRPERVNKLPKSMTDIWWWW